ncbi:MAG: cobyric acid synthase [Magnetococcales bacterium]|nr:cobyric acid synthase [Magnetococcales bacterium]MBF0629956.1 cobyric acid synthase [Magnetococcales bacterium]
MNDRRTLMIQGTTSDAGKSILVAALCRWLHRRGVAVAPFKPQNMALNSAVTEDGGEIGRAQALQALAAGVAPHTDMNPVLLKPNSETGAQVIIQGRVVTTLTARDYHAFKPQAMVHVLESFHRLQQRYSMIVVEGAGSPAEINLRHNDIANMGFAEAVDCPVVLVADIDRGGVFAHLVGTLELLTPSEAGRVCGMIINKFRGDPALLQPGLEWLEHRTGKRVLGVFPFLPELRVGDEDSFFVCNPQRSKDRDALRVLIPRLPRISNHTDFDPLRWHPRVHLHFWQPGAAIPGADLIILPGSKSVPDDLDFLRRHGWVEALNRHLRLGGRILGICGGFQMLGRRLEDPLGVEGHPGITEGLGFLECSTRYGEEKILKNVSGRLSWNQAQVQGYEIHMGVTMGADMQRPMIVLEPGGAHGAMSGDHRVMGCYLHGVMDHPEGLAAILAWSGLESRESVDVVAETSRSLDRLADTWERVIDPEFLNSLM